MTTTERMEVASYRVISATAHIADALNELDIAAANLQPPWPEATASLYPADVERMAAMTCCIARTRAGIGNAAEHLRGGQWLDLLARKHVGAGDVLKRFIKSTRED